jgi:hypothetical protein
MDSVPSPYGDHFVQERMLHDTSDQMENLKRSSLQTHDRECTCIWGVTRYVTNENFDDCTFGGGKSISRGDANS